MKKKTQYPKEDIDFLKDLPIEDQNRFWNMTAEEQHRCISEFKQGMQEDALHKKNIVTSQLEGRIVTKSFQG